MVTVVIVNYNGADCLSKCLVALAGQTFQDFEAIVVDNASRDGSDDESLLPDNRFRLIRRPTNTGFAAASNLGAKMAKGTWLVTLNPDAYPRPDWLACLLAAAERHPRADMFASTQLLDSDPRILDGAGDVYSIWGLAWRGGEGRPASQSPPEGACLGPCGAAAMYRREHFLALGGYDEDYFCYFEDVDLALRMQLAGGQCIFAAAAVVRHSAGGISPGRSDFTIWHCARNRLWTYLKNLPAPLLALSLPLHLAAQAILVSGALARGTARPELGGIAAGLRGLAHLWGKRAIVQKSRVISTRNLLRRLSLDPLSYPLRRALVWPVPIADPTRCAEVEPE
jgi:GT2 family glycosyltransferase